MLFNSINFLIFYPLIVILYFAIPYRWRWILLLCGSYYFYMCWKVEYVFLLFFSTVVDFYLTQWMGNRPLKSDRKIFLLLSIFINLGILFTFKYFNFFSDSLRTVLNQFNIFYDVPSFNLLLPIGISFYTFQKLSYTIDVFNGQRKPEPHLGKFALYVSFFPQLVAGPIERSNRLLPQLHLKYNFEYNRVVDGLRQALWGFFKKIAIADRLGDYVDLVYNSPDDFYGLQIILATVFFAFQIYCDFSGYSDIAIGTARVFGIDLMQNFNRPYFANSISDFWKRWHISLSTWFRDYVYIPLGGNRVLKWRWYYNLFMTFLLSGLWHGANWTFVLWGAIHAIFLIGGIATSSFRDFVNKKFGLYKFPNLLSTGQILTTFTFVCFGWIFFRAGSIGEALTLIMNMFHFEQANFLNHTIEAKDLILSILFITILEGTHFFQKERRFSLFIAAKSTTFRWCSYFLITFFILYFGQSAGQEFIYFQF